jgi:hypothetical protein
MAPNTAKEASEMLRIVAQLGFKVFGMAIPFPEASYGIGAGKW